MIHRGTIYEGHAIFTKQLFLSLFNVATHPIPKVQDPSKQKTIQHVTSTSPCMRSVVGGGVAPAHRAVRSAVGGGVAPWRVDRSPCTRRAGRAWYRRAHPPAEGGWRWGGTSAGADAPMRRTDHGAAGRASTGPGPRPGVGRQAMVAWAVRRGHDISALCVFERASVQAPERASANSGPVVTSTRDAGPRSEPVATSATRRAA